MAVLHRLDFGFIGASASFSSSGELLNYTPHFEFFLTESSPNSFNTQLIIPSEANGTSEDAIVFFITSSGRNPLIGIGTDNPQSTFDIKDIEDSTEGSKIFIRNSRLTKGADPNDAAGTINFVIDSGSYNDLSTSGSVASITSEVLSVTNEGAAGDLILKAASSEKNPPDEVLRLRGRFSTEGHELTGKLQISNKLTVNNVISASGAMTGSDVYIDDWGSVSASLAAAGGGGAVATYTNGADNRVITSTGTDSINGEANLTFDGSTLGVIGTVGIGTNNPTYQLHVSSSTAALGVYERAGGAALYLEGQLTRGVMGTVGSHPLLIAYNSGEVARFTGTSFLVTGSLDVSTSITGSALQLGNLGAENEILIVGANTEVTSSNLLAIDTVNERVGIGTSTPQVKLDIVGESSGEAQVRVAQHDDTSDGPDIRFFKSHNTAASPSAVANDDYIGAVNAFAYDGSTYIQSGFFGFQADGTDGDSKFGLRTRVNGTLTDRITIDAAGDVDVAGQLSINGFSDVSASLAAAGGGGAVATYTNGVDNRIITSTGTDSINGEANLTFDGSKLLVSGSGSTLLEVIGSEGQLFSITDSLSGSLFAVSDISGLPILEVFSDDTVKIGSFNNETLTIDGTNNILNINGTISGSNSSKFQLDTYAFGYNTFPGFGFDITGSGIIVSSSLPSEHYPMVKIGETELLDLTTATALSDHTFTIHNVDNFQVTSGSEPTDVSTNKLFEHTGNAFNVYTNGSTTKIIDASSTSVKFGATDLYLAPSSTTYVKAISTSTPQYVATWDSEPNTAGTGAALKYITSSAFIGGGKSTSHTGYLELQTNSQTVLIAGPANGIYAADYTTGNSTTVSYNHGGTIPSPGVTTYNSYPYYIRGSMIDLHHDVSELSFTARMRDQGQQAASDEIFVSIWYNSSGAANTFTQATYTCIATGSVTFPGSSLNIVEVKISATATGLSLVEGGTIWYGFGWVDAPPANPDVFTNWSLGLYE